MKNQVRTIDNHQVDNLTTWRDKFVINTIKVITGQRELLEFEDTAKVKPLVTKRVKKTKKNILLRLFKKLLRFIFFGIENAFNSTTQNNYDSKVPKPFENRFKDNR